MAEEVPKLGTSTVPVTNVLLGESMLGAEDAHNTAFVKTKAETVEEVICGSEEKINGEASASVTTEAEKAHPAIDEISNHQFDEQIVHTLDNVEETASTNTTTEEDCEIENNFENNLAERKPATVICTHSAVTGSEPDRGSERLKTSYSNELKQSLVSCSYGKDIINLDTDR